MRRSAASLPHQVLVDRRGLVQQSVGVGRRGPQRSEDTRRQAGRSPALDDEGLSARIVADQLGHARISMTQDVYMGRKAVDRAAASALEGLS